MLSYCSDDQPAKKGATDHDRRLGPAGLALHYANIIMQIDTLVSAQNNSLTSFGFVGSNVCFDGYRSLVQAL